MNKPTTSDLRAVIAPEIRARAQALRAASYSTGDIVAYEDRANPRATFQVAESGDLEHGQYRLVPLEESDPEYRYSDLRQAGWTLVQPYGGWEGRTR